MKRYGLKKFLLFCIMVMITGLVACKADEKEDNSAQEQENEVQPEEEKEPEATPVPEETWWIELDTTQLEYEEEQGYYTANGNLSLTGKLNPKVEMENVVCSVTSEFGQEVFRTEITVADTFQINQVGLYWGENVVSFTYGDAQDMSPVSIVIFNENEENLSFCDLTDADDDGDGLYNYLENYFGTDKSLPDTDADGWTDYEELVIMGTDPLLADANSNGILDAQEDSDEDGLINCDEVKSGTDWSRADTDEDGLKDGEEVSLGTNPLIPDTDGDGLSDGKEVANGYNPLQPETQFTVNASATADMVVANISATVDGFLAESIGVEVFDDVRFTEEIPGYLSKAFVFESSEGEPGVIMLSFEIPQEWVDDETIAPVICSYDEERQSFYKLDTRIEGNKLIAETTHFSTYAVLDENSMYQINLYEEPENIEEVYSPDEDSNKDGISDYDTYLMSEGILLTGMGVKPFGEATYEEIQANNDFDGDGLLNGEEMQIAKVLSIPEEAVEFNGNFYLVSDTGEFWGTAKEKAESMGGHLCTITTQEEQDFVISILPDNSKGVYWIGASLVGDRWTWVTGESFEYSKWGPEEPNNENAMEAYVEIYAQAYRKKVKGDWNDASNEGAGYNSSFYVISNTGYVVEWESDINGKRYVICSSNPILADSDADGIGDKEDTAPFVRGLEGGIVGKLTLISSNGGDITGGHAFLALHSYVNDLQVDVSRFYRGVEFYSVTEITTGSEIASPGRFVLQAGKDMTIGSAGTASLANIGSENKGQLAIIGTLDAGGLWYNLEIYKHFGCGYGYGSNCTLECELTLEDVNELNRTIVFPGYHGLLNNCTTVATTIWNSVVPASLTVDSTFIEWNGIEIASPYELKKYMQKKYPESIGQFDFAELNYTVEKE